MNLVTFEDKQNLNTNPSVANINKVTASDMNEIKNAINNLIFPVGSIIYNASSDFNPNTVYGGTWTQIEGKMIIGYDASDSDFDTLGATGGSKTHTQTVDEMPVHDHQQRIDSSYNSGGSGSGRYAQNNTGQNLANSGFRTGNTGNGQPMDIMNPYYVANIWLRTA